MEALGVAANAIAVVDLSFKVISVCSEYAKDVKNAKADIEELLEEVDQLRTVAKHVQGLLKSPKGAELRASGDLDKVLQTSRGLLTELEAKLQPKPGRKTMSLIGIRALRWPFQSTALRHTVERIHRCSAAITPLLQVYQNGALHDVSSKIDKVDNTLETVDRRTVLEMLPNVVGAAYDSHAEEHNSTCLEDTRIELLQQIDGWVNDTRAQTIFWLNGMAGTGKSTISRTIATASAKRGHLGASFFFKRGEADRGNVSRFYTTIAHQLVRAIPDLGPHIKAAIDEDSSLTGKAAAEQFDKLILQPLLRPRADNRSVLVIVVDALDECDGDDDIRQLVSLFSRFRRLQNLPVRTLITSRPELPIRLGFNAIQGEYQDLVLHEIPESIVGHDLAVFFNHALEDIRRTYNASVSEDRRLPESWPHQNDTDALVRMAIPLFIFAATVCRFLSDRRCGSPSRQLQKVLAYQTKSQESKMEATYLPSLEQQLTGLSSCEQEEVVGEFRHIVGTIVILETPLSASALAGLLDIPKDTIDARLDMLHSVLSVPPSSDAPIRLLHLSFRDFLLDPEKRRANRFWVDERKAHERIAKNCLRVMGNSLREDICSLIMPGTDHSAISPDHIASCISMELQYACRHWVYHLQNAGRGLCDDQAVYDFLAQHFLHWLEALSLLGRSAEGFYALEHFQALMQDIQCQRLRELLSEAYRFTQKNLAMIASSPLQIYSSLLVSTPSSSMIRSLFRGKVPDWITLALEQDSGWDQCQHVLEGHKQRVNAVSFSADSLCVASASLDKTVRIWRVGTGECIQKLEEHRLGVDVVFFSPDSKLLVSIDHLGILRLWRRGTGECIKQWQTFRPPRRGRFPFSPDSKLLAFVSPDKAVHILHLDLLDIIRVIPANEFEFTYDGSYISGNLSALLKFSSNSKYLAAMAGWTGESAIWEVDTGRCIRKYTNATRFNGGTSFVSVGDCSLIVVGPPLDNPGTIQIWRAETNEIIQSLSVPEKWVLGTEFSPNHTLLGTLDSAGTIKIWKADTGECLHVFKGHSGPLATLSFSPDMNLVASGSVDKTVRIWRVNSREGTSQAQESHDSIGMMALSSDHALLASASSRGEVRLWKTDTRQCIRHLEHVSGPVGSLAFCANSTLVCAVSRKALWLSRVDTGECVHKLSNVFGSECSFSPDGRYIARFREVAVLHILEADSLQCRLELKGADAQVKSVFSPDSSLVAVMSSRDLSIWQIRTGSLISQLRGMPSNAVILGISPDSELIVVYSCGRRTRVGLVKILRIHTGEVFWEFHHGDTLDISVFSHDSKYLACLGYRTVEVWDLPGRTHIRHIDFSFRVNCLKFDADGEHLITNLGRVCVNKQCSMAGKSIQGRGQHNLGYKVSSDGAWVLWNGAKIFWLPPELRPTVYDPVEVSGSTVVIGTRSRGVVFFRFAFEEMLSQNSHLEEIEWTAS